MAKKTKTQNDIVLSAVKSRTKGITDEELAQKTGLIHAATIRSHLKNAGFIVEYGSKKNSKGRTVRTWGIA